MATWENFGFIKSTILILFGAKEVRNNFYEHFNKAGLVPDGWKYINLKLHKLTNVELVFFGTIFKIISL